MMDTLEVFSEVASWLVLIYVLYNAVKTDCFSTMDWSLTALALMFSYLTRYLSHITRGEH